MFGAIAGGIASALAGGAMSKLFGGGQKAASGGIQGDVLATDNNTVGMGDAGIRSAIQGSNVPNPDEAVPSFVSGAMAKAGKGLLEGTLQAGTSAVSDKLLDLVGLGGKSAADKGNDSRDYLARSPALSSGNAAARYSLVSFPLSAADLPPSPTKSSNLSETAEVPACNVPSRSPLPALAIAPETKLGTASSGLGTLEP